MCVEPTKRGVIYDHIRHKTGSHHTVLNSMPAFYLVIHMQLHCTQHPVINAHAVQYVAFMLQ